MTLLISSVGFGDDGSVNVIWMDLASDVRNGGLLVASHDITIRPGDATKDYGVLIQDVQDAVQRLLRDALTDFSTSEAVDVHAMPPEATEDEDDQEAEEARWPITTARPTDPDILGIGCGVCVTCAATYDDSESAVSGATEADRSKGEGVGDRMTVRYSREA